MRRNHPTTDYIHGEDDRRKRETGLIVETYLIGRTLKLQENHGTGTLQDIEVEQVGLFSIIIIKKKAQ